MNRHLTRIESVVGPVAITIASFVIRLKEIKEGDRVIWDEAHFGKFGAYYLLHEFYSDVHPPLGKMLIGLSGHLANFSGDFLFDSGHLYPSHVNYGFMRTFNAVFGSLVAPAAYFTAKALGYNLWTVYLISFMVTFENIFVVLSKFILLDSMLLFFTATTFLCLAKTHYYNRKNNQYKVVKWLFLQGLSIGCVCSVKWVGLFITVVVGLYTIVDLYLKFLDSSMSNQTYFKQWIIRIINLIVVPLLIYVASFKAHFGLLYKAGTGHASMPSLFQLNLENSDILPSPRSVAYGSKVTIRSHGLQPNLLHSHIQLYPEGSRQHQVTTYGHKDNNNDWVFAPSRLSKAPRLKPEDYVKSYFVQDGHRLSLYHNNLNVNLHSHQVPAFITKNAYEVSGYGNQQIGDEKDDWIIEIVEQVKSPTEPNPDAFFKTLIHPITTNFRLRHAELGCYLATTGKSYPAWGFQQGEVICKQSYFKKDKSTWWNVEDHSHPLMEPDEEFYANPPKTNFWRDFILINFAMQAANNAMIPDADKHDILASHWSDWPFAKRGIRMSSWGAEEKRYFMLPNPFTIWLSSTCVIIAILALARRLYLWQSQELNYDESQENKFWDYTMKRVAPLICWTTHYLPFIIMSRVTYVHHYVPAEFFAIFVAADVIDRSLKRVLKEDVEKIFVTDEKGEKVAAKKNRLLALVRPIVYIILYSLTIGIYQRFSPLCYGMEGHPHHYGYLKWRESWDLYDA